LPLIVASRRQPELSQKKRCAANRHARKWTNVGPDALPQLGEQLKWGRDFEQGTVGFELDVSPQGNAVACRVTRSSGSAILDQRTCALLVVRPASGRRTTQRAIRCRTRCPPGSAGSCPEGATGKHSAPETKSRFPPSSLRGTGA